MLKSRKNSTILVFTIVLLSSIGLILTLKVFANIQQNMERHLKKLVSVAKLAQMYYVEDVNWDSAIEGAITGMLANLDPHSIYISSQKAKENKESFSGKYEGIGIQFDILDNYLTVISPIPGSPSYRLGLLSGDRIIKINGETAIGITHEEVPIKLKGPKGTTVDVTISRVGIEEPLEFTIVRDVIPISTITASFMSDDSTGYIAVNRFAAITAKEVEEKLTELEKQNIKRLILDLRGNSGGYLHEAVKLAGKFIKGHKLIVYTKGRSEQIDEEYYADQFGRRIVRNYPLIILINRGSASASEIVAGAIQDYDRGLILGENSFGKGLVQKEFPLQDGSAVRVTTAKYYTPSGRCIQRNYKGKKVEEYYSEIVDSAWISNGNLKNRPMFHTYRGRTVYGGGGITPDIYVAHTNFSKSPKLFNEILKKRLFFEFSNSIVKAKPAINSSLKKFKKTFHVTEEMLKQFKELCRKKEIDVEEEAFATDREYIKLRIKADIARNIWKDNGYYYIILDKDKQFQKAQRSFDEARKIALLEN